MRKTIAVVVIALMVMFTLGSCSPPLYKHVSSVVDGEVVLLRDSNNLYKVGDTVVVIQTLNTNHVYGKYIGVTPEDNMVRIGNETVKAWYFPAIVIK